MPKETSKPDGELITRLGIITHSIVGLQDDLEKHQSSQKALVYSLVSRGIISQSRASRICQVQRQTISRWVTELQEEKNFRDEQIRLGMLKEKRPD